MAKNVRPTTGEEFDALPAGPAIGQDRVEIDGKLVTVPVMPSVVAFYSSDNEIVSHCDGDGTNWTLGRYADGSWFKRRVG
jgi:hypothetical protein